MVEESIDNAVAQILRAFGDVSLGTGVSLREADVIDDYGTDDERAAARGLDELDDWERISDAEIEQHPSALCFMDDAGLRFHLPAYMRFTLRRFRESDSMSTDATIYRLCDPEEIERLRACLTHEQVNAIRVFLSTCLNAGDDWLDVSDVPLAMRLWQGDQSAAADLRDIQNARVSAANQLVRDFTELDEVMQQKWLSGDLTVAEQEQFCRLIQNAGRKSSQNAGRQPSIVTVSTAAAARSAGLVMLLAAILCAGAGISLYFRQRQDGIWWLPGVVGIGVAVVALLLDFRRQRRDAE